MEGLNRVILCGNLGRDPDLKNTNGGQAILSLSVATTESWWDESAKERKERTEWHRVTVWGKRGEALAKVLTKGSRVWIEGRLQTRSYEKNGEKRFATEIVATSVGLMGGGQREGAGPRSNAGPAVPADETDLPF